MLDPRGMRGVYNSEVAPAAPLEDWGSGFSGGLYGRCPGLLKNILDFFLIGLEILLRGGLKAHYQYRLSVGSPQKSPTVFEQNSHSIDANDFVCALELLSNSFDHIKFQLVR